MASASVDAPPPHGGAATVGQAIIARRAVRNARVLSCSVLVDSLVLLLFVLAGTVQVMPVFIYTMMGGLMVGTFGMAAMQKERARDAKDPQTPMALSLSHQVLQVIGLALMPELSFMFLLILFIAFTSLAMRVAPRPALAACALMCVGTGLVLAIGGATVRLPDASPAEQFLSWAVVSLTLSRCVWIGLYNGTITTALKLRSREFTALTRKAEHLARHDELTGLLNRRSMLTILACEQQRADRMGQPLTVALIDLDHFKAVNATLGHSAGDRALKFFATNMQQLTRTSDRFGRLGDEEFLAVLIDTRDARIPVERLREALKARGWDDVAPGLEVTFSCGLARHRPGESPEELLKRAGDALCQAKREGRDRTRTSCPL